MAGHNVPSPPTNQPYIPSVVESKKYLFGLNSKPLMIARSNPDPWMPPTGLEAYLEPKQFSPLGNHDLCNIWEETVAPSMVAYFQQREVKWSVLHVFRLGTVDEELPPPFVMVGVIHDSLTSQDGLGIAVHCRSILQGNGIEDIHVIVYESEYQQFAGMYKPALTSDPAHTLCEPFSTSLGIPICNAKTPDCQGTAGFFFVDAQKPGKLYMITARHVLFHPDEENNTTYRYRENSGDPKRKVQIMSGEAFKRHCKAIELAIQGQVLIIKYAASRIEAVGESLDEEELEEEGSDAEEEGSDTEAKLAKAELSDAEAKWAKAEVTIQAYQQLLDDLTRDWSDPQNRVLGHVIFSPPPFSFNGADGGFTEDFAVVEIDPKMVSKANLKGNVIDVGSVPVDKLTKWMHPHDASPHSFTYPTNRLVPFDGTVPDEEMYQPNTNQDLDPVIMVIKNGSTTGLTVGRLNNIRSVVHPYFKGKPGEMSMEIAVLPRTSRSGPFSAKGDSGSAVVDSTGRVCGLLTGGDGVSDASDCTFLTSINWIVQRLAFYGIEANIFPVNPDL